MGVNLPKLLEEGFQTARIALNNEYNDKLSKAKEAYKRTTSLSKLMDKENNLNKQILKLKEERDEVSRQISNEDPYADINVCEAAGMPRRAACKKSDLEAFKKLKGTPADINRDSFKSITNKFHQMMALACGVKEQRAVLGKFYALDWTSLGINLPLDVNIGDIEIKDGIINIENKALGSGK